MTNKENVGMTLIGALNGSRILGRRIRNASLTTFALLLLGCEVSHVSVLEFHRADLVTPTGRVPMLGANEIVATADQRELAIKYEDLVVRVGVLPRSQHLLVSSNVAHRIDIRRDEAFYQRNGGAKRPLSFRSSDENSDPRYSRRSDFELPPPLTMFHVLNDGTLKDQSAQKIEMREDDVHVIYLPFTVDAERFVVDLEFSVEVETRRHVGVPATP